VGWQSCAQLATDSLASHVPLPQVDDGQSTGHDDEVSLPEHTLSPQDGTSASGGACASSAPHAPARDEIPESDKRVQHNLTAVRVCAHHRVCSCSRTY
jgi:hypothetical protein